MVVECFIEIERVGKYWKRTRTWSGYHEILKRKAGVLETQTVALATSSGELSPVLLVSPVKPVERPGNERAPLRVPDMKHMKILGPKPINPKQAALAESLVSENFGLFGDLNEILRENSQLAHLQSDLAESLVMAKAPSTFNKYQPLVSKWEAFAKGLGEAAFPANKPVFTLYLQQLKNVAVGKGTKGSAVPDTVYAVDYAHSLRGLELPGKYEPARLLCCATRRLLARPVIKKRPVEKKEVVSMLDFAVPDFNDINLNTVRAALFAVLAFCLEARYDDLCDLRLCSFYDYGEYFIVFIEHRKTDQYREGQFVPIYDNGEDRGACAFLRAVLPVLRSGLLKPDLHIFRRIGNGSVRGMYMRDEPLHYSRVRELVRELLVGIGLNPDDHGLHSFRSGAATHAANQSDISDRQWGKHGGWADGSTAQTGYVLDSASNALTVPKALAL